MVEGDLRDLGVGIDLTVEIGLVDVLERVSVLVLLEQITVLILSDQRLDPPLLYQIVYKCTMKI